MKVKKDKISLVVACYNVEDVVVECIRSIKKQTYTNIEVFLIDDGSKDKTAKVIKNEIKDDKRFKYYYHDNRGVSFTRNRGLDLATGSYISFIDSDDYLEPDFLEKLYDSIKENKSDFAICSLKRVYPNKTTYHHMKEEDVKLIKFPAMWNKLCKTSLLKENNIHFLENIWYEDLAVGAEVFISSKKFSIVDEFLHNYRQQENSLVRRSDNRIFDIYKIMEEIEKYAKNKKLFEKYKDNIEFMHIHHILIGTIYRSSFHPDFSKEMIEDIYNHVDLKYDKWYKNPYLKNLSIVYRLYLYILRKKSFKLLYFLLKHFSKYLYL